VPTNLKARVSSGPCVTPRSRDAQPDERTLGKLPQTAPARSPQRSLLLPSSPLTRKLFCRKLPKHRPPPAPAHLQTLPRAFHPAKRLRAQGTEPRRRRWHFSTSLAVFGRISAVSPTPLSSARPLPASTCLQEFTELLANA